MSDTTVTIEATDKSIALSQGASRLGVSPDEVDIEELGEGTFSVSIKDMPGRFEIFVQADKMAAYLKSIGPPIKNGKAVTAEEVLQALEKENITFGLNKELIEETTTKVAQGREPQHNITIATGKETVNGADSTLDIRVGKNAENKDSEASLMVNPGQVIAVKNPPGKGTNGITVHGDEIPAMPGADKALSAGENIDVAKDGLSYSAAIYGKVVISATSISISSAVDISEDKMSATLSIYPTLSDNSQLTFEDIQHCLKKSGVTQGIKEDVIKEVLAKESPQTELEIARGVPAKDGVDGKIRFAFHLNNASPEKIDSECKEGNIDPQGVHKELFLASEVLAKKVPQQQPSDGYTVCGETLSGKPSTDKDITAGDNVVIQEDGLTFVVADDFTCGYVDFNGGTISVAPPLRISDDRMQVLLDIHPPSKFRKSLTKLLISKLIKESDVHFGVSLKTIEKAISHAYEKNKVLHDVVIAKGKAPVKGQDAVIGMKIFLDKTAGEHKGKTDLVDFRERGSIRNVEAGDILAQKLPAKEGECGHDVYGNELPAEPGEDKSLTALENVKVSEDGLTYSSEINGMVNLVDGDKIGVFEQFEVAGDVDYSTGNLDMKGIITVKGWVRTGFKVKASGDIIINGGVEDSIVDSGSNIFVGGGIIGGETGKVKARGSVEAAFLEEAYIYAGGDIIIKDVIMRSKLISGGSLFATSGKGRIRGGTISAMNGVEANEIGSVAGVKTVVMAGIDFSCQQRLLQVSKKLKEYTKKRAKMDKILAKYVAQNRAAKKNVPKDLTRKMAMLAKKRRNSVLAEAKLTRARKEACERLDAIDLKKVKIVVHKAIYAGSAVAIGKNIYKVTEDIMHSVTFILNDRGQVVRLD